MKITINTETKTITLLESCKFSEVQELIEELGGEWNIEIEKVISIDWDKLTTKEDLFKKDPYNPYPISPIYCLYEGNKITVDRTAYGLSPKEFNDLSRNFLEEIYLKNDNNTSGNN